MSIFNDSFSIELNHPLDKEAWKVIEDAELDNTERIYFTTPSDKRVEFIKADVLDKIRDEMEDILIINQDEERIYQQIKAIIDKHMAKKRGGK